MKQEKVSLEANTIEIIFAKQINKMLEIYKSMAIDFEISKINYDNKRRQLEDLYDRMNLMDMDYSNTIREWELELRK